MDERNEKIIDTTGTILTPGDPEKCEGNGRQEGIECCCDECDFFLQCFPDYDKQVKTKE